MVTTAVRDLDRAVAAVGAVVDPEIPVVTVADLGILRDVGIEQGRLVITITPTYSGCPAMRHIEAEVADAARSAGFSNVEVRVVHDPPWTTDWITPEAKAALAGFGITGPSPLDEVLCPRCTGEARLISRFGSTACKALMACARCGEPFDHFKEH
jgi:ring-1,2-phenylacetyl-CoA epoxidase subunit PaaD